MLTNQNLENSNIQTYHQTKKQQKPTRMHNLSPLSPYDTNIQVPMIKTLGKYQFCLDQKLGSGMAGDVYVGINTQTAQLVCVKVIDTQLFKTQHQKTMLQHEIKCQKLIQCQNTIKIYDVFDNNSFCFIVAQFCEGGDLYKLLKFSENGLSQSLVKIFGNQIAKALLKMKSMQIIHRDIKPQNILLRNDTAKLGDFGFAVQEKNLEIKEDLNIGSPLYMSLQALEQSKYSYASDIFSYGIVLYEMMHKISPWECNDQNILKQKMKSQQIHFKQGLSQSIKNLISKCLEMEVSKRISIQQVLNHDFFKGEGKFEIIEQKKANQTQQMDELKMSEANEIKTNQKESTLQVKV